MSNIPLSQDELKLTIGILANVQLKAADGALVFDLIKKLDSYVAKTPENTPNLNNKKTEAIPTKGK